MPSFFRIAVQFLSLLMVIEAAGIVLPIDEDGMEEAIAAESNYSLSISCVDPVILSFAPSLNYSITVSAPDRAAVPTRQITAGIANAVNSEGTPNPVMGGIYQNSLLFYHDGPVIKVGGVQCSSSSSATLTAHGDSTDDTQYDIALATPGTTNWIPDNQVDHLTSGSAKTVFGPTGIVNTSAVRDGSDSDGIVNGEISFGGNSGEGAYRIFNAMRYFNTAVTSHAETITYVFTLQ